MKSYMGALPASVSTTMSVGVLPPHPADYQIRHVGWPTHMEKSHSSKRSEATVCKQHPNRTTRLRCSHCNLPICIECSHDAAVGQKCPKCSKPQGRYRVVDAHHITKQSLFATAPVTFFLITAATAVFVLSFLEQRTWVDLARQFGAFSPAIRNGEIWRALTVVFFHDTGLMHILSNMYALYLLGPRLEREIGSPAFAGLYFAASVGGTVLSVALGDANGFSIGASGAIFGLFGAWIFVAYKLRSSSAGRAMFNQLGVLLLINLALPLFIPQIDWRAHGGGLLVGIGLAWVWSRAAAGRPAASSIRAAISYAILSGLLIALLLL